MWLRTIKDKHAFELIGQSQGIITYQSKNIISIYKDQEIKTEKMRHLKITTVSLIVGALGMTKKGTDKHIYEIHGRSSFYEI